MFDGLKIVSPKRSHESQSGWNGFFPYYAGFPEAFANSILGSAELPKGATVLDPWNGSGTTTFSASQFGFRACGLDVNPAMVIVARARLLPSSEADALAPIAKEVTSITDSEIVEVEHDDPLLLWFLPKSASLVRSIERRARKQLVGEMTLTPTGTRLENISGLAATIYVALFSMCRKLAAPYRTSNPTWLRHAKHGEDRIHISRQKFVAAIRDTVAGMAHTLSSRSEPNSQKQYVADIQVADTSSMALSADSADFVLTSPPYCTRIDYTAATRIELAVLSPLLNFPLENLRRQMMGSPLAPKHEILASRSWGECCNQFLEKVRQHRSKASDGYYHKTHLDYFDKLSRSLCSVSLAMKHQSAAIMVVQDSYYKDVYNDLPRIVEEMCELVGLSLRRREDFRHARSMGRINRYASTYKARAEPVEAVLCFEKTGPTPKNEFLQ